MAIVEGLDLNDFSRERIDASVDELREERDAVASSAWSEPGSSSDEVAGHADTACRSVTLRPGDAGREAAGVAGVTYAAV